MSSDPIVVSGIFYNAHHHDLYTRVKSMKRTMFINIISSIRTMFTPCFKVFFSMLSSQISVLKLDHASPLF